MTNTGRLGYQNSTLEAVGGEHGLAQLVDAFYAIMDSADYARDIRAMHPQDLSLAKEKLTTFLTGWMGGPQRYAEKFGRMSIPGAHAHFVIKEPHRDAWLNCMNEALIQKSIPDDVREYLIAQLSMPAQRIVEASAAYAKSRASN
ncbi:MAG: group II truncated hemoglobin [Methylococcales bacterium]|nr:group II truncated hemoglobin [Methylococcales bacterium]